MSDTINIAGLDKAAILAALHNGTRALGMGRLHDIGRDLTVEEARTIMGIGDDSTQMFGDMGRKRELYFDYVQGRPIKVDLSGDEFDPWLYDRDAGQGAAARAIAKLRETSKAVA